MRCCLAARSDILSAAKRSLGQLGNTAFAAPANYKTTKLQNYKTTKLQNQNAATKEDQLPATFMRLINTEPIALAPIVKVSAPMASMPWNMSFILPAMVIS